MLRTFVLLVAACLLIGCSSTPTAPADPTREAWYAEALQQLTTLNQQAEAAFKENQQDDAAARIKDAEPLVKKLLSVPHPTFEAAIAASDMDDLYARMLLSNRHYGWARLMFQKNVARWKLWQPASEETQRRLKIAQAGVAECDKHIGP